MPAITASMVGELRAKTDAPMMECKKALTEADGDLTRAEEILRVKLGNKAGKAASRITAEGVVAAVVEGGTGALVEINCETDFVSKNDSFLTFAKACAQLVAARNPADVAALSALPLSQDGFGPTVEDVRKGLIGKIGENMSIRRFKRYAGGAKLAHYLHGTRIGVMVEFEGDDVAAKDVAMQIAASTKGTQVRAIDAKPPNTTHRGLVQAARIGTSSQLAVGFYHVTDGAAGCTWTFAGGCSLAHCPTGSGLAATSAGAVTYTIGSATQTMSPTATNAYGAANAPTIATGSAVMASAAGSADIPAFTSSMLVMPEALTVMAPAHNSPISQA